MRKLFLLLTLAVFALSGCATTGGLDLSETAGPPGAPPVGPNTDLTVKSLSDILRNQNGIPIFIRGLH